MRRLLLWGVCEGIDKFRPEKYYDLIYILIGCWVGTKKKQEAREDTQKRWHGSQAES